MSIEELRKHKEKDDMIEEIAAFVNDFEHGRYHGETAEFVADTAPDIVLYGNFDAIKKYYNKVLEIQESEDETNTWLDDMEQEDKDYKEKNNAF